MRQRVSNNSFYEEMERQLSCPGSFRNASSQPPIQNFENLQYLSNDNLHSAFATDTLMQLMCSLSAMVGVVRHRGMVMVIAQLVHPIVQFTMR